MALAPIGEGNLAVEVRYKMNQIIDAFGAVDADVLADMVAAQAATEAASVIAVDAADEIGGAVVVKPMLTRIAGAVQSVIQTLSAPSGKDFLIVTEDSNVYIPDLQLMKTQTDVVDAAVSTALNSGSRPSSALSAIALADYRPVDVVLAAGDSHQQFGGYGLYGALSKYLVARYDMYASPFFRTGNGQYTPTASGGGFSGAGTVTTGAPSEIEALSFPTAYTYVPDGVTSTADSTGQAVTIYNVSGAGSTASWRCDYHLGTFPTSGFSGAGTMTLFARLDDSPFSSLASSAFSSKTGSYGRVIASLTVAANPSRTQPISFKYRAQGDNAVGPIAAFGARALRIGAVKGISVHSLYAEGGQSGYDMAYHAINTYTNQQLIDYFTVIRSYQIELGWKPIVVLTYNTGHNDRNETSQPSLGWRASSTANSAAAYVDNAEAFLKRYRDIWRIAGWDETELYFVVLTSFRLPATGALDAQMQSYAKISEPAFSGQARVSYVQLENLTTATESASYANDGIHYTSSAGYDFIAQRLCERAIPGFLEV